MRSKKHLVQTEGRGRIWLKENKGTLRPTCCECLDIPDSAYINIIEEVKEGNP